MENIDHTATVPSLLSTVNRSEQQQDKTPTISRDENKEAISSSSSSSSFAAVPNPANSDASVPSDPPVPSDPILPVLTERNNVMKNGVNANRMVSPVLLKLRRKQERSSAISSNPVNPVLIVPPKKLSGFPAAERYMSPTDSLMSPISRGLLARSRRAMRPSPAYVPPKILDNTFQEAEREINDSKC